MAVQRDITRCQLPAHKACLRGGGPLRCLTVDGCFGYGPVQEEEPYCLPGHSLTADVTAGGAEIITGGKQINGGALRRIFSFQTDKRRRYTVATARVITFADRNGTESQVPPQPPAT